MNNNYLIFNDLGILDLSDIKEVSQGNHNVDYYFIGYHDYNYQNSYVSTAVTLPDGTNMPELATSLKEFEFNGTSYKGFMFKLPETLTSIAGNLTITMVLSSLEDDTQLCSSQVNIPIHATDTPTEPTITNAQYDNMLETINENFNEIERKIDAGMLKGDKGDKGDKGEEGDAATIEIGEVKTVESNKPAKVTNVGTETNAIFDFEIPKGEGGMSNQDKDKLESIEWNAQVNKIETIALFSSDGTHLIEYYPDGSKKLQLPLPEKVGVKLGYEANDGILRLLDQNGSILSFVDLPLELIVNSGYYDADDKNIVLVLANGATIQIPAEDLVDEYNADGTTITKDGNNTFSVSTSIINRISTNENDIDDLKDDVSGLSTNKADKTEVNKKLDKTAYVVDSRLSDSSTNPVQNKILTTTLGNKSDIWNTGYKLQSRFDSSTNKLYLDLITIQDEYLSELTIDLSSLSGKIDTISVNGVEQTITNKNVDITVPTDYVTNQQLTDGLNSKQNNLTSSQLQAVNSGATSTNIAQINTNASNITDLQNSKADITSVPAKISVGVNQGAGSFILSLKNANGTEISNSRGYFHVDNNRLKISDSKIMFDETGLATEEFVNSSIATNTATFRGTYSDVADLPTTGVDINDYAFVITIDANGNTAYNRYKFTTTWEYEYTLNNSSFTAEQWAAIQSGITQELVAQITTNKNDISGKANTSDLSAVATSGLYTDLIGIPPVSNMFSPAQWETINSTINNGTLTIQKNGTSVGTFTANQSDNSTINIEVPTGAAASKGVVTTIDTSANLPTSNAVKIFVEGKGYITSAPVTSVNGQTGEVVIDIPDTSEFANKTDLGTQATFSLSGTTLTITPKE